MANCDISGCDKPRPKNNNNKSVNSNFTKIMYLKIINKN